MKNDTSQLTFTLFYTPYTLFSTNSLFTKTGYNALDPKQIHSTIGQQTKTYYFLN